MFLRKKDIPLNKELSAHKEALWCFIILLILYTISVAQDIKAGNDFTISRAVYIYKSDPTFWVLTFAFILGTLIGHISLFKRKVLMKYGTQYEGKIVKAYIPYNSVSMYFIVEYTDGKGRKRRYRNPGIYLYSYISLNAKKCTVYRLGMFTYVHGFDVLCVYDDSIFKFKSKYERNRIIEGKKKHKETMDEFRRLTRELGSEERALEEMKKRTRENVSLMKNDKSYLEIIDELSKEERVIYEIFVSRYADPKLAYEKYMEFKRSGSHKET